MNKIDFATEYDNYVIVEFADYLIEEEEDEEISDDEDDILELFIDWYAENYYEED